MMQLQIAPTIHADLDAILDTARATYEAHQARHPRVFSETTLLSLESQHLDAVDLAGNAPNSFSARRDDDLLGFVLLKPKDAGAKIADIGVLAPYRRTGIGLALLEACGDIALQRNWRTLRATVWDGNDASHRLFQKAGFSNQDDAISKLFERPKSRAPRTIYSKPFE